jgi:hypothetical protein
LFYRVGFEWCEDLEVVKTTPITEPVVQLNIGANFTVHGPGKDKPHGHIRARDPLSGKVRFEIPYDKAPPHASLLSTAGGLLFVPEADGMLSAYDANTGKRLWSHNDGQGHDGGIISYANQRQAIHCRDDGLGQSGQRRLRHAVGLSVDRYAEGLRRVEGIFPAVNGVTFSFGFDNRLRGRFRKPAWRHGRYE